MNFDITNVTFAIFFSTLCGLVIWYYLHIALPFWKIPSVHLEFHIVQLVLTRKKLTKYTFKKLNEKITQFFPEGLLVAWIFKPIVFIFHDEFIKNVIKNNLDKAAEYRFLHEAFGIGLFTGNKCLWKKRRRMFDPLFRTSKVKNDIEIFNKQSRKLVEKFHQMDFTAPIEVTKYLKSFSFTILCETVLGLDSYEFLSAFEKEKLFDLIDGSAECIIHRIFKPWLYFINFFPEGRRFLWRMKTVDEIIKRTLIRLIRSVSSRMASKIKSDSHLQNKITNKSLAEFLVEHHLWGPDFSLKDMISELKIFIAAGYDTVAIGLNWSLFLLGQHPDIQDCVYEELKSLEGNFNFEDIQRLTYLECVIKESLRLYSPVPIFGRALENDVLLGKYKLPKGTTVCIPTYAYHRNPKNFPNPDAFDPSRFLNVNCENNQWKYLPFSSGIRNCIGYKFAMLEMKVALAHILREFKIISYDDYHSTEVRWEIVLIPDKPIHLKFVPRD